MTPGMAWLSSVIEMWAKPPEMPLIIPDWPAPEVVRAVSSTRLGGVSVAPYHGLNLGEFVGDAKFAVVENRKRLKEMASMPSDAVWLRQVHGAVVVDAASISSGCEADASLTETPGIVCVVQTADCLPVLFCDRAGGVVGAAHAGWRGIRSGIIEAVVQAMRARGVVADDILAWLGPAIGPQAFEVGQEVRAMFVDDDPVSGRAFMARPAGKYLADIFELARIRLARCGITRVFGGGICTAGDSSRFFSHRRDGVCGRQASLIWLDQSRA